MKAETSILELMKKLIMKVIFLKAYVQLNNNSNRLHRKSRKRLFSNIKVMIREVKKNISLLIFLKLNRIKNNRRYIPYKIKIKST